MHRGKDKVEIQGTAIKKQHNVLYNGIRRLPYCDPTSSGEAHQSSQLCFKNHSYNH